jgi:hypothetical protein
MINRLSRPAVVGAGITFRPLQRRVVSSHRLSRAGQHQQQGHISRPATVGAGITFRPVLVRLRVTENRIQMLSRIHVFRQPYINKSLLDTVAAQPPLFIHVTLP